MLTVAAGDCAEHPSAQAIWDACCKFPCHLNSDTCYIRVNVNEPSSEKVLENMYTTLPQPHTFPLEKNKNILVVVALQSMLATKHQI